MGSVIRAARFRGRGSAGRGVMLAVASALLLAACDSPTIPARALPYDFTLATDPALVFHWPVGSTIHVWPTELAGERDGRLGEALAHGMAVWNQAVLYDDYRLETAPSPEAAEIVVVWTDDPAGPVSTAACTPDIARAVTTFCVDLDDEGDLRTLRPFPLRASSAPSSVRFVISIAASEGDDPTGLRRLLAHELGHALGIFRHAPSPEDLMWGGLISVDAPSPADRQTVQVLYHTVPDLRP